MFLFLLLTRSWRAHSFYLALSLFSSHCPSFVPSPPPLCLSQGIACMPGRWLKEPVRLSSQGFHLVILHLGIHTTLLPHETSCLNTNSLKETSHCHFNTGSLLLASLLSFLHPFSTPSASLSTYFLLVLFYVVSLIPGMGEEERLFLSFFCLFDSVCISNCVRADAVSGYGCWDGCGGNLQRAVWFGGGHRVVFTTARWCLLDSSGRLALCLCFVHVCNCVLQRLTLCSSCMCLWLCNLVSLSQGSSWIWHSFHTCLINSYD